MSTIIDSAPSAPDLSLGRPISPRPTSVTLPSSPPDLPTASTSSSSTATSTFSSSSTFSPSSVSTSTFTPVPSSILNSPTPRVVSGSNSGSHSAALSPLKYDEQSHFRHPYPYATPGHHPLTGSGGGGGEDGNGGVDNYFAGERFTDKYDRLESGAGIRLLSGPSAGTGLGKGGRKITMGQVGRAFAGRIARSARRSNLPFLIIFIIACIVFFSALAGVGYRDPNSAAAALIGHDTFDIGKPVFDNSVAGREKRMAEQRKLEEEWARKKRPNAGAWMQRQRDDRAIRYATKSLSDLDSKSYNRRRSIDDGGLTPSHDQAHQAPLAVHPPPLVPAAAVVDMVDVDAEGLELESETAMDGQAIGVQIEDPVAYDEGTDEEQ